MSPDVHRFRAALSSKLSSRSVVWTVEAWRMRVLQWPVWRHLTMPGLPEATSHAANRQ
jgi:hypothetical protein